MNWLRLPSTPILAGWEQLFWKQPPVPVPTWPHPGRDPIHPYLGPGRGKGLLRESTSSPFPEVLRRLARFPSESEAAGLDVEEDVGSGSLGEPCWQPPSPKEEPAPSDLALCTLRTSVLYLMIPYSYICKSYVWLVLCPGLISGTKHG